MIESQIIEFKGLPLFQRAKFSPPELMQGEIKDFACFFYMVKGAMASFDSRGLHKIGKKEAIMKSCGNYIQNYLSEDNSEECEAIAIYLYPDLLKEIYKDQVPEFISNSEVQAPKKFIGNQLIEQYMNGLSIFFEEMEEVDEELGVLKLKELIMILLRSEQYLDIQKFLSEIFSPVNLKLKEAIQNNLFNPLDIKQLAFLCNMSLSTFKREFKKVFDDTPAHYIKVKRLERAASELLCSEESISSIAYDSGFQDVSTFSSIFKDQYGSSPREYRSKLAEPS